MLSKKLSSTSFRFECTILNSKVAPFYFFSTCHIKSRLDSYRKNHECIGLGCVALGCANWRTNLIIDIGDKNCSRLLGVLLVIWYQLLFFVVIIRISASLRGIKRRWRRCAHWFLICGVIGLVHRNFGQSFTSSECQSLSHVRVCCFCLSVEFGTRTVVFDFLLQRTASQTLHLNMLLRPLLLCICAPDCVPHFSQQNMHFCFLDNLTIRHPGSLWHSNLALLRPIGVLLDSSSCSHILRWFRLMLRCVVGDGGALDKGSWGVGGSKSIKYPETCTRNFLKEMDFLALMNCS